MKIEIPNIPLPTSVQMKIYEEEYQENMQRRQRRHEWYRTILGAVAGYVLGKIDLIIDAISQILF